MDDYDRKIGLSAFMNDLINDYHNDKIKDLDELREKTRQFKLNSEYGEEYRRLYRERSKLEDRLRKRYGTSFVLDDDLYMRNGGEIEQECEWAPGFGRSLLKGR